VYVTLLEESYFHVGKFVDAGVVCYLFGRGIDSAAISCLPLASIPDASKYY
jgi:hypothetical protein